MATSYSRTLLTEITSWYLVVQVRSYLCVGQSLQGNNLTIKKKNCIGRYPKSIRGKQHILSLYFLNSSIGLCTDIEGLRIFF